MDIHARHTVSSATKSYLVVPLANKYVVPVFKVLLGIVPFKACYANMLHVMVLS